MGLGFKGVNLLNQPKNFQFFRGNHDDPAKCRAHPNYITTGDFGPCMIDGWKVFVLAGAWSIDSAWRKQHNLLNPKDPVFWEDEELSYNQLWDAIEVYEQFKPEVVLSHECPSSLTKTLLSGLTMSIDNAPINRPDFNYFNDKLQCAASRTATALQNMFEIHRPEHWVFGHYHINRDIQILNTHFRCVAELDTYEIPAKTEASCPQHGTESMVAGVCHGTHILKAREHPSGLGDWSNL